MNTTNITERDVIAFLMSHAAKLAKNYPGEFCTVDVSAGIHADNCGDHIEWRAYVSSLGSQSPERTLDAALDHVRVRPKEQRVASMRAQAAKLLADAAAIEAGQRDGGCDVEEP